MTFLKQVLNRLKSLVLEIISFKFLLFVYIVHFLTPGVSGDTATIINLVAGGSTLIYKGLKDINNRNTQLKEKILLDPVKDGDI